MKQSFNVGVIGATGMVGQRFALLLADHPWFKVTVLAASPRSAGQRYEDAVKGRWAMPAPIPAKFADMMVYDAARVDDIAAQCDFVFCAIDLPKAETRALEEAYAKAETPVVSNNSACRALSDVPMMVPEINADHAALIPFQRQRLGTQRGFIAVKPNCSIQSYVPAITPLMSYGPKSLAVCTYQAISGAGKTFESMPEIIDNIIPYIGGEEEKSEREPLKIWGRMENGAVIDAAAPLITAQCLRVPCSDGHMAAVFASFEKRPEKQAMLDAWASFEGEPQKLRLPSAPTPFIKYCEEDNRPQTKLDRDFGNGMGVTIGRLREDALFQWRFVSLSHNTLRGAAGGGVLTAELLCAKEWIIPKA